MTTAKERAMSRHPVALARERKLRARIDGLFSGTTPQVRDWYREAITALLTRDRWDRPMTSCSARLDDTERMGFSALLNNVEHGVCLIRCPEPGVVEIAQHRRLHRIELDRLRVITEPM